MKLYYSHLTKVIVLEHFFLKIMSTHISTFFKCYYLNLIKNNCLYYIFDSDPRDQDIKNPKHIQSWGFLLPEIYG